MYLLYSAPSLAVEYTMASWPGWVTRSLVPRMRALSIRFLTIS